MGVSLRKEKKSSTKHKPSSTVNKAKIDSINSQFEMNSVQRDSMLNICMQANIKQKKKSEPITTATQFLGSGVGELGTSNVRQSSKSAYSSVSGGASTQHSEQYQKSLSSNSPSQQITPTIKNEENNIMNKVLFNSSPYSSQSGALNLIDLLNFTEITFQRYHNKIKTLPDIDQTDFLLYPQGLSLQVAPDYAQEVYNFLRKTELQQIGRNYLKTSKTTKKTSRSSQDLTEKHREFAVWRIMELCVEKEYKIETMFLGIHILDSFLAINLQSNSTSPNSFNPHPQPIQVQQLPLLFTACTILAAKLEQPMTPSINRMIKLLSDEEKEEVDKNGVIQMEDLILKTVGFDFNYISPLVFLERFLRLTELQCDQSLLIICLDLLKLVCLQLKFLEYRPSLIAAAVLNLGLYLLNREQLEKPKQPYYPSAIKPAYKASPVNIWNHEIIKLTGIQMTEFQQIYQELLEIANIKYKQQKRESIQKILHNKLKV